MDTSKWKSIMLPRHLEGQLEVFSQSTLANNLGFTNKSQIAALAIREFIEKHSKFLTYLDFIDLVNDEAKILDHQLGKMVSVKINKDDLELFCNHDNSDSCIHTRFLRTIPRFQEKLHGFPKPNSGTKIKTYTKDDIHEGLERIIVNSTYRKNTEKLTKKKLISILQEIIHDLEQK